MMGTCLPIGGVTIILWKGIVGFGGDAPGSGKALLFWLIAWGAPAGLWLGGIMVYRRERHLLAVLFSVLVVLPGFAVMIVLASLK